MMTDLNAPRLDELVAQVTRISPKLADCWQATAIIESLGYTDRAIREEFGFEDALALGRYVYGSFTPTDQASIAETPAKLSIAVEFKIFFTEFSRSFMYAIPLMSVLLMEYLPLNKTPNQIPAQLGALLTLSTITSLITSGGFVQMIQRQGQFYVQMGELPLAQKACMSLLKLGVGTSIVLSILGLWFGFYLGLFADHFLALAAIYYVLLNTLWMFFALLPIFIPWGTPISLLGLTIVVGCLRLALGLGALESQIIAVCLTLIGSAVVIGVKARQVAKKASGPPKPLPQLSAQVYMLSPYFCYGVLYFSFIFADRVVAGSAINPASGLIFAIDSTYQRRMDLALLNFLLLVPMVEYLSYRFIYYWFSQSKMTVSHQFKKFSRQLYRQYFRVLGVAALLFMVIMGITYSLFRPADGSSIVSLQNLSGSLGYLFFSIGLLNAIILFSLTRIIDVLTALVPGFLANLGVGYLLSHLMGVDYAVLGLIVGASIFAVASGKKIIQAIHQPDYMYYLGGY
jgi:hypothetical protein